MKIKTKRRIYDGFVKVDELVIEASGRDIIREVVVRKDAVAALVFDTMKGEYLFTRQFRVGPENDIVEIVAGIMDNEGESPESCIMREIEEELGYKTDFLQHITTCYFSPGGTTEKIHVFYAEVSEKISKGGGVGDEDIETVSVSANELVEYDKFITDAKTKIAVQWVLIRTYNKDFGCSKMLRSGPDPVVKITDY